MRHAISKYSRDFVFIVILMIFAVAVGGYILTQERLRLPFITSPTFALKADFVTGQAVTPGQGQTVRVSGVQIGDIGGVKLHDGIATITMNIDPKYKHLVRSDATALLRPKTGLKDMFIELNPGNPPYPVVKPGFTIPIKNTLPDINPDEVLAALDADTRDYLKLLVSGAGEGLKNVGGDLREVLARFEPTFHDLARVNGALVKRHNNLSHLIHVLNQLNTELASKGPQLATLINSSAAVFHAFAIEGGNISRAVADLPGTLTQTTSTLNKVTTYANVLGPTVEHLRPFARDLAPANRAIIPFARAATPIIRDQIRPFVVEARPLVRNLKPAAANLATATPFLTRTFVVLNHLFNMLGFNPDGTPQPPTNPNRDEGLLFWLGWLGHNADAVFGTADAHGPFRALTQTTTCATLMNEIAQTPSQPIEFLQGLTGVLTSLCGGSGTLPPIPNIPLPPLPSQLRHGYNITTQQAADTLKRMREHAPYQAPNQSAQQNNGAAGGGSVPGTSTPVPGSTGTGSGAGSGSTSPNGASGLGTGVGGGGSGGGGSGGGGSGAGGVGGGGTGPSGPLGLLKHGKAGG